ncbi:hypothetical protein F4780DRAFT_776400 [Xylariomycetidae sp. FL0641]|nr:hypothetical protein F4780DRAFT_776400 [Xylariomycetidae sp. FL0641]
MSSDTFSFILPTGKRMIVHKKAISSISPYLERLMDIHAGQGYYTVPWRIAEDENFSALCQFAYTGEYSVSTASPPLNTRLVPLLSGEALEQFGDVARRGSLQALVQDRRGSKKDRYITQFCQMPRGVTDHADFDCPLSSHEWAPFLRRHVAVYNLASFTETGALERLALLNLRKSLVRFVDSWTAIPDLLDFVDYVYGPQDIVLAEVKSLVSRYLACEFAGYQLHPRFRKTLQNEEIATDVHSELGKRMRMLEHDNYATAVDSDQNSDGDA